MDADHRHELKTNELAEGLSHIPQLLKDNANMIIGITLIAIGLITWPLFTKMNRQKDVAEQTEITQSIQMLEQDVYKVLRAPAEDAQAQDEALSTLLINTDALLQKTADIDNPNLAAMAQIKAAQAIRTELHLRKEVDSEMLESQIQKAKDAYQQALEIAGTSTLKAIAQFGLGLCSEELGQTDQAAEIYQQIIDDESYQATVLPVQAQQRLDGLEDNSEVFIFADVPVVIEESTEDAPKGVTASITEAAEESTTEDVPDVEEPAEAADAANDVSEETAKPKTTEQ